jgi:hypothetical protein
LPNSITIRRKCRLGNRRANSIGALLLLVLGVGLSGNPSFNRALSATSVPLPAAVCATRPPNATPVAAAATPTPAIPSTADNEITAQVAAAVTTLIACWNDADWQAGVSLVTDAYLQATLDTADRPTAVATLQALTRAGLAAASSLDAVADVRIQGTGFANAKVAWHQGNAVKQERWRFVAGQDTWLLDKTESLDFDLTGDAVGIEADVDGVRLHLSRDRLVDPGTVVVHVRNLTAEPTSLTVFRTGSPAQLRDRLAGRAHPPAVSAFAGEVTLLPNEEKDLVLVDLAADVYTVVAGFHGPDGDLRVRDAFVAPLAVAKP